MSKNNYKNLGSILLYFGRDAFSILALIFDDFLQQTVDGETSNFTMDLNSSLTQVLDDGLNTYLYGLGRIGQDAGEMVYFHGDALGSVRQMTL